MFCILEYVQICQEKIAKELQKFQHLNTIVDSFHTNAASQEPQDTSVWLMIQHFRQAFLCTVPRRSVNFFQITGFLWKQQVKNLNVAELQRESHLQHSSPTQLLLFVLLVSVVTTPGTLFELQMCLPNSTIEYNDFCDTAIICI